MSYRDKIYLWKEKTLEERVERALESIEELVEKVSKVLYSKGYKKNLDYIEELEETIRELKIELRKKDEQLEEEKRASKNMLDLLKRELHFKGKI